MSELHDDHPRDCCGVFGVFGHPEKGEHPELMKT